MLLLFLLVRNEFDNVLDGVVYGAVIGFGFAMTENTLYFIELLRRVAPISSRTWSCCGSCSSDFDHTFYSAI